jgi:PKD repeat protein
MKALLRPLFVGGLSIAIAATSLVGASSVALAANMVVSWTFGSAYTGDPVYMATGPVNEGGPVFLTAKITGGAGHGPYSLNVNWGDGTSELYSFANSEPCGTLDSPGGCVTAQKRAQYLNAGSYTVVVVLDDPVATKFNNLSLSVLNSPPSFTSFGLSASDVEVGQPVTAIGRFTDGTTNDTHTVKLDWGDSSPLLTFVLSPGARDFTTGTHTYKVVGDYTVSAIVTDATLLWTPGTATLSVHAANVEPTMSFEFTAGPEGGDSTLAVTFADADALDTHTVTIEWGDGQTTNSGTLAATETTFNPKHVYADIRDYSLVVTLTDSATTPHVVTEPRTVSPTNASPVVAPLTLSPSPVVDGQELTVSGTFTDPTGPGTTETFTVEVAWDDSTPLTEVTLGTEQSFTTKHTYNAAGSFKITATVKDSNGGSGSATADLVVGSSNHAPSNLTLGVSGSGANVVVDASFNDPDAGDTHTASIDWGDGDSEQPIVDAGAFTASHEYLVSGTYTVTATVTDAAGAHADATTQVVVTVSGGSAEDVLDEMSARVLSFDLDRNTERWLLRKLDDLKDSLAYGNGQVCSSSGTLAHLLAFAERTLSNDQYAALNDLATKLEVAAGCSGDGAQSPKAQKAAAVTTAVTPAPTQKKDTTTKDAPKTTKTVTKPTGARGSSR